MSYIDLHTHTHCSDGTLSPEELVTKAKEAGLEALAITDHDAVDGVKRARSVNTPGLEVISGVELSAREGPSDVHILGYFIDLSNEELLSSLETFRVHRINRAKEIVTRLNKLKVPLQWDAVLSQKQGENTSVGRPHIARALLEGEYVNSISDAFNQYLGYNAPAFVPKFFFSVSEAIEIIHKANGLAVLAHPGSLKRDELIENFVNLGLDGLEVIHPEHNNTLKIYYNRLASKYGLVTTGGSDYHGSRVGRCDLGGMNVPYQHLVDLKCLRKE